jgi:hypothetical protein
VKKSRNVCLTTGAVHLCSEPSDGSMMFAQVEYRVRATGWVRTSWDKIAVFEVRWWRNFSKWLEYAGFL